MISRPQARGRLAVRERLRQPPLAVQGLSLLQMDGRIVQDGLPMGFVRHAGAAKPPGPRLARRVVVCKPPPC